MVYCKEVGEIGDQIVALNAREAMGVPSHVNISASGGGGSTFAAYPINVPKQRI
jgi:hypothetical protein